MGTEAVDVEADSLAHQLFDFRWVGPSGDAARQIWGIAGEGIALADQERIFEPGVRLDWGRPGSGLGLSIARDLAEAHGGSLTVESAWDSGATFRLTLPRGR